MPREYISRRAGGSKGMNDALALLLPKAAAAAPLNSVKATRVLAMATQPTAGDTITIGSVTYTFVAAGTADAAGEINLGANIAATKPLLVAAINGDSLNTAHPLVTAAAFSSDNMTITAIYGGVAANSIATTETFTAVGNVWAGATMTGGVDGTPGAPFEQLYYSGYLYTHASETAAGVTATAWYRHQLTLVT